MSRPAVAVRGLVDASPRLAGPVVVGIAGGVASGKTVLAEELRDALGPASVDVVSTDGFLLPNRVLAERGLVARKGFAESYDVAALRAFLAAARAGRLPLRVPHYSHRIYDVDGEREVPAVDVLIVEGVNVLAAVPDQLDVAVYVDVDEALLESWFRRRFLALAAAGRDDPASFYRSFASMDDEALVALADEVWRGVNLVNLREHIAPSRRHADLVITMGPDHAVLDVAVRDDGRPRSRSAEMPSDQTLVDQLERVWASIADFGRTLDESEWKTPTEVPGWTVQDNLAHVTGLESMLLGRPPPQHVVPDGLPHVKNDFGRSNEVFVDSRRGHTGADVLAEFEVVTAERLAQLRGFGPDDFGAASFTPVGPGTVRDLLPFRVFDSWVHEQDMRRAVGRPGDLEGPVADVAMGRIVRALPFVVGKKVAPLAGTTVTFELSAPLAGRHAVMVEGRARLLEEPPAQPTVAIRTDGETFARLACGRLEPAAALAAGAVAVVGDAELGRRVVEELNFVS